MCWNSLGLEFIFQVLEGHPYNHCEKIAYLPPFSWPKSGPIDIGEHESLFLASPWPRSEKNPRIPGLSKNCLASDTVLFFSWNERNLRFLGIMTFQFIRIITILLFGELGSPKIVMILFIDVQDEVHFYVSTPKDPKTWKRHETKPSGRWPETCRPEVSWTAPPSTSSSPWAKIDPFWKMVSGPYPEYESCIGMRIHSQAFQLRRKFMPTSSSAT